MLDVVLRVRILLILLQVTFRNALFRVWMNLKAGLCSRGITEKFATLSTVYRD